MSTCGPCTSVGCDRDDSGNKRQISAINLNGRKKEENTLMRLIRFLVLGRRGMSRVYCVSAYCLRCVSTAYNRLLPCTNRLVHAKIEQKREIQGEDTVMMCAISIGNDDDEEMKFHA